MAENLNIWPEQVRCYDGLALASATLEFPSGDRRTLWYKVPGEHAASLHPTCDPFVVGTVYLLMQAGHDVRVHGQVSRSLLRSLVEFQAAWVSWVPGLHNVQIRADREAEAEMPALRKGALVAYSGGVDSCFTAFRHARGVGLRFPHRLAAGVMVHGFDIPLDEPETFKSAVERSRRMLASLGLDLIPIATNYRALVADWSHSFAAALSSCMMLLGARFAEGLIGQGLTYSDFHLLREGSNPLTDPMLSSSSFRIVPDGGAFSRADKILAMSEWKEFLEGVRVCWAGPQKDRNCCVCEKCIRNILTFRALGLGLPPCFEHDVTDRQIRELQPGGGALPSIRYAELGKLAKTRGVEGPWIRALDRRLAAVSRLRGSVLLQRLQRVPYYATRPGLLLRRIGSRLAKDASPPTSEGPQ